MVYVREKVSAELRLLIMWKEQHKLKKAGNGIIKRIEELLRQGGVAEFY